MAAVQPLLAQSTITAVGNLGTTAVSVIGANPSRTSITFHAPGAIDIYVAPTQVLSGGVSVNLSPSTAALAGCYHIFNGADRMITGPAAGQAWQAFAASGSSQPLTIMEGFS
jgi:hypothetical protein